MYALSALEDYCHVHVTLNYASSMNCKFILDILGSDLQEQKRIYYVINIHLSRTLKKRGLFPSRKINYHNNTRFNDHNFITEIIRIE